MKTPVHDKHHEQRGTTEAGNGSYGTLQHLGLQGMRCLLLLCLLHAFRLFAAETPPLKQVQIDCKVVSPEGQGRPVGGAQVWVTLGASYNQDSAQDKLLATGRTDTHGRCQISVQVPDDGTARFGTIIAKADGGVAGQTISFYNPGPHGKPVDMELRLHPPAECRVRLTKPDGAPASGVRVWVEQCSMPQDARGFMFTSSYNAPRLPEIGWEATTDAEGRCRITGLPKDAFLYLLHDAAGLAQLPDKYNGTSVAVPQANGSESTHQLVVSGTLRGRVMLPDGSPASGGILSLLEMEPYQTAFGTLAETDADGRFEITQIPPSNYKITFRTALRDQDRWIGDTKEHLHVQAGQVTDAGDLVLAPVCLVTAKVLDAESGDEIEKPIIFRLKAGAHQLSYRQHRSGSATHLVPDMQDAIPVQLAAGERKSIEFRLSRIKPENRVSCVVLRPDGNPAARALVAILGGQGNERFNIPRQADEKGAFTFQVKTPQDALSILAWTEDAISEFTEVKAGGHVTVKLQDSGLASIHGQIRDESGKPVSGASFQVGYDVDIDIMGGPLTEHVNVGTDGRFRVPRLPRSIKEVTLFAYQDGYTKSALRDQEVQPGRPLEWNPVLHSMGSLSASVEGTVVDKAGAPVPGVTVTLSGDSQPDKLKPATTDAAGRFRFDKLAAGQAFVRARHKTETTSRETQARTSAPQTGLKLILPDADGRISGIVLDHRGQPAVGAVIDAYSRGTKTTADAQGRFTLSGMEKGWFTADINHLSVEGRRVEKRCRLKTGMKDIRVTLPAQSAAQNNGPVPVSLLGKPAPEIHVATWLNSPPLATKAGGGKVRILDFWGLECGPCLAGFPKLQAFWQQHQKDGIEVIATGDDHYPEAEVREFLQRHPGYTFPVAIRPDDATDGRDYGVHGIPLYVVIGQDGTVLSTGHDWAAASATALKAAKP